MLLARFIAGYPLLTALLSAVSVCTLSSLSIVDECGGWQDFVVDTKLENYMKSDNYQTEMYDALGACILTQNELVAAHFGGLQTTAALAGPTALRRRLQQQDGEYESRGATRLISDRLTVLFSSKHKPSRTRSSSS